MKHCLFGLLLALSCWGCSDDATHVQDLGLDAVADTAADTTAADTATQDLQQADSAVSEITNPFGFIMTLPKTRKLTCKDLMGQTHNRDQLDMDWICTFETAGVKGHVYIRNHAVSCKPVGMSILPLFQANGAFISVGGKVSNLSNALYEWGGGHHNDLMGFDHGGKYYKYYHSSFGFGWRKCQNMDCVQIYPSKTGKVEDDGCTSKRTIPAVCLQVDGKKTDYAVSDFADTFYKCPGDPNP